MSLANKRYVEFKRQNAGAKAAIKAIFSDRKSAEVPLASREKRNREIMVRERASIDPKQTEESSKNTVRARSRGLRATTVVEAAVADGAAIVRSNCAVCGREEVVEDYVSVLSRIVAIDANAPAPFAFLCGPCARAFESKKR